MAVASAAQAGTIALSIKYLGSTTGSITTLGRPNASSPPGANVTLTQLNFGSAAGHDPAQNHWFEVDMAFTGANAGEDFQNIAFDITTLTDANHTGVVTKVDRAGNAAGTTKWYADNPSSPNSGAAIYSGDGDAGAPGDLLAISVQQSDSLKAAITQTGEVGGEQPVPTPLGWFVLKTMDTNASQINLTETFGNNVGYFVNNQDGTGTPVATSAGFSSTPFPIPQAPEPTSLALLSLGAFGMIRRRRA